jgi:glycosyltransferase involved in cell wall biosynthesis
MTSPANDANPLISLVLACYNQEKFVAEAVRGVLSQTYTPLDIVIVDDCSTDRTPEIIKAELARHPARSDIRFVRNEQNLTTRVSSPMTLGLTKGKFVVIGCGDDIMLPDMIAEMAKVWIQDDVSLVIVNASYIDKDSHSLNRFYRDPNVRADDSFETLARDGVNACCFGPVMGFERELYDIFGWPPAYLTAADIMFPFYAYLRKGARFIEQPLLKYRVNAGNTSLSLGAEKSEGLEQLITLERIHYVHLAHALFMREQFYGLRGRMPERYAELEPKIAPLLAIQTAETARKFVQSRIKLDEAKQQAAAARLNKRYRFRFVAARARNALTWVFASIATQLSRRKDVAPDP